MWWGFAISSVCWGCIRCRGCRWWVGFSITAICRWSVRFKRCRWWVGFAITTICKWGWTIRFIRCRWWVGFAITAICWGRLTIRCRWGWTVRFRSVTAISGLISSIRCRFFVCCWSFGFTFDLFFSGFFSRCRWGVRIRVT